MLSLIMLGWMRENRKEGKWVVRWDMIIGQCCATFLSLIIPHFGRKNLGGKWGMWPTHFSSPLFFPLPFSPHPSKGKYFPHPIFLSHFLSSPIFPPSKHTLKYHVWFYILFYASLAECKRVCSFWKMMWGYVHQWPAVETTSRCGTFFFAFKISSGSEKEKKIRKHFESRHFTGKNATW